MDNNEYIELFIAAYKDLTQKIEIERTKKELKTESLISRTA